MDTFMKRFRFRPECHLSVGVERESFITDAAGTIVPGAERMLGILSDSDRFGYELSACQLEDRVGPHTCGDVRDALIRNDAAIAVVERRLGFGRSRTEVAPEDMPLDVYPDPTGRYQAMVETMPTETLRSACRVIGTHVHIGMSDAGTALRTYDAVCGEWERLCRLGDGSDGERLRIYRRMASDFVPRRYGSWERYHRYAVEHGFDADPRKCWHLIRISVHGTIEFRMFGTTGNVDTIMGWVEECHRLCAGVPMV